MMESVETFSELLQLVRAGRADAARTIVERYSSAIRVAVRTRMTDAQLRQQFDSMDVCQSVLASFFLRMSNGLWEIHEPGQLVALLAEMANHKVLARVRSQHRQCRDVRRTASIDSVEVFDGSSQDPAEIVADADLVQRARQLMSPELRELSDRRCQGESWNEIAATMGGTAESRRKQLERELNRIAECLGVELGE